MKGHYNTWQLTSNLMVMFLITFYILETDATFECKNYFLLTYSPATQKTALFWNEVCLLIYLYKIFLFIFYFYQLFCRIYSRIIYYSREYFHTKFITEYQISNILILPGPFRPPSENRRNLNCETETCTRLLLEKVVVDVIISSIISLELE